MRDFVSPCLVMKFELFLVLLLVWFFLISSENFELGKYLCDHLNYFFK